MLGEDEDEDDSGAVANEDEDDEANMAALISRELTERHLGAGALARRRKDEAFPENTASFLFFISPFQTKRKIPFFSLVVRRER